jgi:hypothetical protein
MGVLKAKATNTEAVVSQPAFEAEEGAAVETVQPEVKAVTREQVAPEAKEPAVGAKTQPAADAPKEEAPAADAPKEEAPAVASTAVAVSASGVVKNFLTAGKGMVNPLVDLKDAFKGAGIEVDYATFPRLRIEAGSIASTEGKEAGDFIEIQVISYSPSWTVTTGTDGKESKEHVRFSDDGKVTNPAGDADEFAGTPLDEYKAHLVAQGFEKAAIKEYLVVYGLALDAQEADFAHLNEMVALSLAPESRKKFDSYKINRALQARMGRVKETSGNPVVRWSVERVTGKERAYFNLTPSHGKTAPVDLG